MRGLIENYQINQTEIKVELENDQKKHKEKYINIKNELSYIEEKISNLAEKSIKSKNFQKLK